VVGSSPVSAVGTIYFPHVTKGSFTVLSASSTSEYIAQICLRCVKDASAVRDSCISQDAPERKIPRSSSGVIHQQTLEKNISKSSTGVIHHQTPEKNISKGMS